MVRVSESTLRASHASRLSAGHCSPESGLVFIDVLGAIEQIAYRSRKIADHMAGRQSAAAGGTKTKEKLRFAEIMNFSTFFCT